MEPIKKVILITGAYAGMGKEFAKDLLKDGHMLISENRYSLPKKEKGNALLI